MRHEMTRSATGKATLLAALVAGALLASPQGLLAQDGSDSRFTLALDFGQQSASGFNDRVDFVLHAEPGDFSAAYDLEDGSFFGAGLAMRVAGRFAVGVAYSSFDEDASARVSARLPHPLFFDRHRVVEGGVAALAREETAIHLELIWMVPVGDRLAVELFAGPSFFDVSQQVATDVDFADSFPFDSATFVGVAVTQISESKVGFHAGVDLAYYFSSRIGVGLLARFAEASIDFTSVDGDALQIDAGGLQLGGGLRFRF